MTWQKFTHLLTSFAPMPYQKKTLATMGIMAPHAIRGNTFRMNPSQPVTTFVSESWKTPNCDTHPIDVATTPAMTIRLKSSEWLFNDPAM